MTGLAITLHHIMQIHIGMRIREELQLQERSVAWFARQICCTRQHAYKIFEKDNLDILLLAKICKVLNHDFFSDISSDMCNKKNDTCVI